MMKNYLFILAILLLGVAFIPVVVSANSGNFSADHQFTQITLGPYGNVATGSLLAIGFKKIEWYPIFNALKILALFLTSKPFSRSFARSFFGIKAL